MKKWILLTAFLMSSTVVYGYTCPMNSPYHQLVNKENPISKHTVAGALEIPNIPKLTPSRTTGYELEVVASQQLEKMFTDAKREGINLKMVSGYRTYEYQATLYNNAVRRNGVNQNAVAKPGTSEHQLGLAVDLNWLEEKFGDTKEGIWLANNSYKYGYILRYPKGKEHITGYIYEPWHFRYVGTELANKVYEQNITLEELDFCCPKYTRQSISLVIDGIPFVGLDVLNIEDVTYIPVRKLAEVLGMDITYNNGVVTCTHKGKESTFKVVDDITYTNQPFGVENNTYVPLREFVGKFNYAIHILDRLKYELRLTGNLI